MEGHRGDNTRWDDAKILIGMKTIIFGHTFSTKKNMSKTWTVWIWHFGGKLNLPKRGFHNRSEVVMKFAQSDRPLNFQGCKRQHQDYETFWVVGHPKVTGSSCHCPTGLGWKFVDMKTRFCPSVNRNSFLDTSVSLPPIIMEVKHECKKKDEWLVSQRAPYLHFHDCWKQKITHGIFNHSEHL